MDETIFHFWCRTPETANRYQTANKTAATPVTIAETVKMRTISFILAFAFVMAGSSMAGSPENGLPGIGTFSYNGTPIATPAPMVVAAAN
ncbi:hypothetical protein [Bradyrhizobium sp. CCBAU 51753]|uniref:hypothetical protein n=1 Tax=Bradyrhizobium sp. CCBAU 51753 TaxID=1325100 RepID=UPI00188AFD8E|nr:hypothetical protein [Bradyrhizobium sp. CCBAU 51753]